MRELGILYTPENIRAIAEKRKWQTRRVSGLEKINEIPGFWHFAGWEEGNVVFASNATQGILKIIKPRYRVGDILYVKEAWAANRDYDHLAPRDIVTTAEIWYPHETGWKHNSTRGKKRSPMFMPKWAARPELKRRVTDVRVQRVQDISEEDAIAEGIEESTAHGEKAYYLYDGRAHYTPNPVESFASLWDSINGKKYPWDSNPWVFAYTFEEL